MDYVVFGIGFGATILVLGLLLRDLGPRLRYRRGENGVLPADVLVAKVAWDRFCNALGAVLAIGGILFLIATFVCILLRLSDDTGGWVMLGSLAFFFLLILYWTWAFFDRFGAYGILPERPVAEEPEPEPSTVRRPAAVAASNDADHADAAVEASDRDAVPVGPTLAEIRTSDDDHDHVEEAGDDDATAEEEHVRVTAESETVDAAADYDAAHAPEPVTGLEETPEEPSVITPEERLARHGDPIDHESAAGDLDTDPGVARPSALGGRRPNATQPTPEPEGRGSVEDAEGGDPPVEEAPTNPDEDVEERSGEGAPDERHLN